MKRELRNGKKTNRQKAKLEPYSFAVTDNGSDIIFVNEAASLELYGEDDDTTTGVLPDNGNNNQPKYVLWGSDNQLPYNVINLIGSDEVMSANKHFNVLCCYGTGLRYTPADGSNELPTEVKDFVKHNAFPRLFLEMSTDMKMFYFCVVVIVLNKGRDKIATIRPKEACYCRFEVADENGKINHVYFADFKNDSFEKYEAITLLDSYDPLKHLNILLGKEVGPDGKKEERTNESKFAVVCKFPTPGNRYYPIPYYTAVFKGHWFDIKKLIGLGKRNKIKNHSGIRYLVQINEKFWGCLYKKEHITDKLEQAKRQKKEYQNINNFLSGVENSGKTLYSGFYQTPDGVEEQMIKISVIDTAKEGGDWSEDIQEASNMLCYADGVHPNLLGATPGKGQQNNSGSDKRELFTLKQSLEIPYHDIMKQPFDLIADFNGWNVNTEVPMITLTTLDQHKDAQQVTAK